MQQNSENNSGAIASLVPIANVCTGDSNRLLGTAETHVCTNVSSQAGVHALQLMHAGFGSLSFNFSIACCSARAFAGVPLARRMLSTSTVNLIASAAAFVRK
eukprot:TRINITY_DN2024_c0_g1_i1.p2 TRINITY_DN2024_c0_g1~~TRINITY_DN2024_c0_g1_i1.p2  ORF type:complete len:102 (+),score=15.21 TRINITY_DN2024_c0_g1_i1:113-418(+)